MPESAQLIGPKLLELIDPLMDFAKRLGVQLINPLAPLAPLGNQLRLLQNVEVLGNRRKAHMKWLGQRGCRLFPVFQYSKNLPPDGMRDRFKNIIPIE